MEQKQVEPPVVNSGEPDLLPEHCHYRDEGCALAASCFNCPLPACVHDRPGGKQQWLKKQRDAEMARLFYDESKGIKELAAIFGVNERTVQRALRRMRNERNY